MPSHLATIFLMVFSLWLPWQCIHGNTNLNQLYSQQCEEENEDGSITYYACISEPVHLLRKDLDRASYDLSVVPENSTCGNTKEPYCTLGIRNCFYCDSSIPSESHRPGDMFDQTDDSFNQSTWWQSITWTDYPTPLEINISISFDKMYELQDDLTIEFQSSRPRQMVLYKSADKGDTWEPLQYYSQNCKTYTDAGIATKSEITRENPDTVICTDDYSQETPYTGGQVEFPIIMDRYALFAGDDLTDFERLRSAFDTTNITDFLSFTDLKISLLYPATDGNEYLQKNEDLIRYYYAITGIQIIASCQCNLHGKFCTYDGNRTMCECSHNTMGDSCEQCLPLYNNRPWEPGHYLPYPDGTPNECQKCECNSHADSCTYNRTRGFGVCNDCYHNTTGDKCEKCLQGFFHNSSLPMNDSAICIDCDCEPLGIIDNITTCNLESGQCQCRELVEGRRCDVCVTFYYGLLLDDLPGTCKPCTCNLEGTVGRSNQCEPREGQCPCKPNIDGRACSQCKDRYYNFPGTGSPSDCLACNCDPGGSTSLVCNKTTGQCPCRPNTTGRTCSTTEPGYYSLALDANKYQPRSGTCELSTALLSQSDPFSGRVFMWCEEGENAVFEEVTGEQQQPEVTWQYYPVLRYTLNGTDAWSTATLTLTASGDSGANITTYQAANNNSLSATCPVAADTEYSFDIGNLTAGGGLSWISPSNITIDKRCQYTVQVSMDTANNASQPIMVDSVVLIPDYTYNTVYMEADNVTQAAHVECVERVSALSTRSLALAESQTRCRNFVYATGTQMAGGGLSCDCDTVGTIPESFCAPLGGQCSCKPGVLSRQCDVCEPGFYNFTVSGCEACDCYELGSSNLVCNYTTGQCPCNPGVATSGQPNVLDLVDDLQCTSCLADYYGMYRGIGCDLCNCNTDGSNNTQCDDLGVCECKETIHGDKCDVCEPGYFSFSADGCSQCNCSAAGSVGGTCGAADGACICKTNVMGDKCDECKADSFNLDFVNPDGCQKCFCYGHGTSCSSAAGFAAGYITQDNTGSWDLSSPLETNEFTYVSASAEFLGFKLHSYGQLLSLHMQSNANYDVDLRGEPLVVLEGNGLQVYYNGTLDTVINNDGYQPVDVRLQHGLWLYNETSQPNYFQFYSILANMTDIHIKRLFLSGSVKIKNITMVTAVEASPRDTEVMFVEDCDCTADRKVDGNSCENCATGNQRTNPSDNSYEKCIACNCNSRGETSPPECDQQTGVCLNCRNGTVGDNCESCAPNVEGANCDTCKDEFWGLSQDGCQSCDCHPDGSSSTICDKTTGQCTCRSHVTGQKCDECEDNYNNLTNTGCQECNSCYALVMDEVNTLREMRDNLTSFVTQLDVLHNDTLPRPFHERLDATVEDIQVLLVFLGEATTIEDVSVTEINRLNSTLQHLRYQLDVIVMDHVQQSNQSVISSEGLLDTGGGVRDDVNTTVIETYNNLMGVISSYQATIESLVASLSSVEAEITSVYGDSADKLQTLTNTVATIEENSQQAFSLANDTLVMSQSTEAMHNANIQGVSDLTTLVTTVDDLGSATSSLAQYTLGNASALLDSATWAMGNTSAIVATSVDIDGLSQSAGEVKQTADMLNQQANEANAGSGSVVGRVNKAQADTTTILQQLADVRNETDSQYARISAANTTAHAAEALATKTTTDATNMLTVLQDFDSLSQTVEASANSSLESVQKVKTLSEEAIQSAQQLRTSLEGTYDDSQQALQVSQTAKENAQADRDELSPVSTQASQLRSESESALPTIQQDYESVVTKNLTIVTTADTTCKNKETSVATLEDKADTTMELATNASRNINETQERIQQLVSSFSTLTNINTTAVDELRTLVTQTDNSFNLTDLLTTVILLNDKVQEQRQWLNTMKERKDSLQNQISRLKDVRQQILPAN